MAVYIDKYGHEWRFTGGINAYGMYTSASPLLFGCFAIGWTISAGHPIGLKRFRIAGLV